MNKNINTKISYTVYFTPKKQPKIVCYMLNWSPFYGNGSKLFKLDLNTRMVTSSLGLNYELSSFHYIPTMAIDENGMLCICNHSENQRKHTVHRFSLG